jgi:drug/metabolite transporter (DMT)-like permease
LLSFCGALLASLGNIVSARNQHHHLPVIQSNAYAMMYGALSMFCLSIATGKSFTFEISWPYVLSLGYLAIFGSVVTFSCFLTLLGRIGPDKAGYIALIVPMIALIFSTVFEGYRWTGVALLGVLLVLGGNLVIIQKKEST